jgi:hypothetical protein
MLLPPPFSDGRPEKALLLSPKNNLLGWPQKNGEKEKKNKATHLPKKVKEWKKK